MRIKAIVFLAFWALCVVCNGQEKGISYSKHLSISNGLAHNGITSIFQDAKGYLWFATYDGLNRYDGYQCKTYKNSRSKKLFGSNRIRSIGEDGAGNLWLGTDEGISIYNYSLEDYKTIYTNKQFEEGKSGPVIRKFIFASDSLVICLTDEDGILVLGSDFSLKKQLYSKESRDEDIQFYDAIQLDETYSIFCSSKGLFSFNLKHERLERLFPKDIFNGQSITKIDNRTFLVTRSYGVCFYEFEINNEQLSITQGELLLSDEHFICSAITDNGELWLGTYVNGVIRISNVNDFKCGRDIKQQTFNVKSGFLRSSCFLISDQFGCWLGTYNKGIFQFSLKENPFHYYSSEFGQPHGIRTNHVFKAEKASANKVFISTNEGGTSLFNLDSATFEALPLNSSISPKDVFGPVFTDSRGNTWFLRYRDGVYLLKKGHDQLLKVEHNTAPEFQKMLPRCIAEDRQGNVWIGAMNNIFKIHVNQGGEIEKIESLKRHKFFEKQVIYAPQKIYVDPELDCVWIGTQYDGLLCVGNITNIDLSKQKIEHYLNNENDTRTISSNFVSDILRMPNGELWIGTEQGGINKLVDHDSIIEFICYKEEDGLSNNVVKSILCEDNEHLWISTNIGLNRFNIKNKKFRVFNSYDGLSFEDFAYAGYKTQNGKMLFGGHDGMIYFNPKEIDFNEPIPSLEFGELSVFNKVILPNDTVGKRVLLEKRLMDKSELVLKHNENSFSIELTALHYSTPENHFLKYQLLPFNETWIEVSTNERIINYNGLPPGDYELKVVASNSLKEWGEIKTLKISIKPPFWATIPAYALYALLLGGILNGIIFYTLKLNNLRHRLEIEQIEKDKVKEINSEKLRFFSNISHEIKTPLTLIFGPVNMLMGRFKGNYDVSEKLELIHRQSRKISQLVEQVHDFQKSEGESLRIDVSTFCFNSFVEELVADFEFISNSENKKIKVFGEEELIYVSADKDKMEKIFNNLLNNAFKYTNPNDVITIKYSSENSQLHFSVSDTGIGISAEDIPHIFERFFQARKKDEYISGSGIGLAFTKRLVEMHYGYIEVESQIDHGTLFLVRMPIIASKASVNQIEVEKEILLKEEDNKVEDVFDCVDAENINVSGEFSKAVIYLAEDNSDLRVFIKSVLSNFFTVRDFANGKECQEEMLIEWPDLVVSDIRMPELNGFDLCKNIKSNIKTSHIPIILLTACATIEDHLQGLEMGADAYIKKPFEVQHLVTRIETLLRNRKQLRERYHTDFPLSFSNKEEGETDAAFLDKLYTLMQGNLDNQDLDISSFARELYLNRSQFYKKVKALTNQTPYELLKMYRLRKASELLEQNHSVTEVAEMTGFKNRTHFSRLFKEKYNVTPGSYASQLKNNKGVNDR